DRRRARLIVARLTHDHGASVDPVRLGRIVGDPVVADQRIGEGDDLAVVAGIGDRLLITGHRGVENHLAGRRASRAGGFVVEPGAGLEQPVGAHLINAWICLNSGVPASLKSSNSAVSTLVTIAPERSIFCRPRSRFSAVRELTASRATCTSM